jgi:hypothetical protein
MITLEWTAHENINFRCNLGLINYIGTKAKCRYLKKLTCKGTLRQVFICLRPPPSWVIV